MMLCYSAPPACSSTPLRPSVHYPSISLGVDHLTVFYILDQTDLYRFEVRLELYGANDRVVVRPPSLSPSHPPTPPPSRWPGLTNLPPLAKFQLVWRRVCEALLSSSSLAVVRNTRLCCLVCLTCRRCKRSFCPEHEA